MRGGIRFVLLGLVVAIAAIVIAKYIRLGSSRSFNQIDSLSVELGNLPNAGFRNTAIGFKTNLPGDGATELYFRSAFAIAPVVLSLGSRDTTLVVEHPGFPPVDQAAREVIKTGQIGSLSYKLIR